MTSEAWSAELGGVTVTVREEPGGLSVELDAGPRHVAWSQAHEHGVDVTLRDLGLPAPGSRVMVDGRLVKVAHRDFDEGGHAWLTDEDTGLRVRWA